MAINKKYGKVFKELRKQRQFKLAAFQDLGVSPATISNFENGRTLISFSKLQLLLDTISVTIDEYLSYTQERSEKDLSPQSKLIINIKNSILDNTYSNFYFYQLEALQLQEYYLYLALKNTHTPLDLDEVGELSEYFDQIKYWRIADLYTLYLSINHLKPRQCTYILEGFFIEKEYYSYSPEHEPYIFQITCHVISHLIYINHSVSAKHFINYLESHPFKQRMYTQNLLYFIKGLWIAQFEDYNKGIAQSKKALDIFKHLEKARVANYYDRILNRFLKEVN
jgi:Rgg/GadR/MutR family transcriptional activator